MELVTLNVQISQEKLLQLLTPTVEEMKYECQKMRGNLASEIAPNILQGIIEATVTAMQVRLLSGAVKIG